jgi:cobalt-zinc-cadmium efflux system membrane fusion protein
MVSQWLTPARLILALVVLISAQVVLAEEDGQENGTGAVTFVLNDEQRKKNGIVMASATTRPLRERLTAPGEVVLNAYASSEVTPRIASHALARHALLGEKVKKDQPLARLSSIEMAEAQGNLIIAENEWRRVEKLGKETVSDRRYTEAKVTRQQAMAKAQTYGMTRSQVQQFMKNNDISQATGAYDLLSPQDGIVISDNFLIGERVEPGQILFELTDETSLWVEARLAARKALGITPETPVRISSDGVSWQDGSILQIHHSLDEQTRTRIIRVEIDNQDDSLHPGEFVQVEFMAGPGETVLAVPASSIATVNESPVVFRLAKGDEFSAQPIKVGITSGDWVEVLAGLSEGDQIAVEGVYGLKSELLKSEGGEGGGHSH